MDKKVGFVLSHRYTADSWLMQKGGTDYLGGWHILLQIANSQDAMVTFMGKDYPVKRGQKITSIRKLAIEFGWNEMKIRRFLDEAVKQKWITKETIGGSATLITIINYNDEQDIDTAIRSIKSRGSRNA